MPQNRTYSGPNLLQIAMPMGGIGAGCICLNGEGALQDFSIRHRPSTSSVPDDWNARPAAFAVLHIPGANPVTRLVEGPLPPEKIYDQSLQAQGFRRGGAEGLPRFQKSTFENGYPFGHVQLEDARVPLSVRLTGWSPLIPLDDVNSGLPAAILEYTLENPTNEPVDFQFSYHLSHLLEAKDVKTTNAPFKTAEGSGIHFGTLQPETDEKFGTAALFALGADPKIKAMWFRGGWFDSISVLWRELSTGNFTTNDGAGAGEMRGRNGGSLLIEGRLEPGESTTLPVLIAWHFPNSDQRQGEAVPREGSPAWRPFYAGQWKDAAEVASYLAQNYAALRRRTVQFADALWNSTLPADAVDAVASNLAILKSPTILRQENGNLWAWEGCFTEYGSCPGSCTHVWNYAQALPHLFPQLERTLREQELMRSMDERGHVNFRSALPDGPTSHGHHAAADGQLGGILKVYRDYRISGDRAWAETMYPLAQRSLDYCIRTWDPEREGTLREPHHNTYDIEFWGPDGMCGSIYVGALSAFVLLSRDLGHTEAAERYAELAAKAARVLDEELFNGEYYFQKVQWEGLSDTSFVDRVRTFGENPSETQLLEKTEGPKYQYGNGCLSDGIIGGWMARIYGVETPLKNENVRSTLRAIFEHNFKTDLAEHACTQRPGYATGHEAGLLLCSWPHGDKPTLPFVYSDEVWTGIEYQVASHLIEEGLVEEGLKIIEAARSRYDGHVRNPFNEYECGSYYARALASFAVLNSLSGFRYDAVTRTLEFGPRLETQTFEAFFSTASAFGTIRVEDNTLIVNVLEGELAVENFQWRGTEIAWSARIGSGESGSVKLG